MSGDAFHSYLRSFFPFQPPDEVAHVTVTLSLKPGDVIFVHSFHDHGWADGTRLDSGERGWLPTTYCRPYNPPAMKYLLDALEGFWDIARNLESNANLDIFRSQSYVHGFLSGVKFLLVSPLALLVTLGFDLFFFSSLSFPCRACACIPVSLKRYYSRCASRSPVCRVAMIVSKSTV